MKQWPPAAVCQAASYLHHICENGWNGQYVTEEEVLNAFDVVKMEIERMPERPEHLPKGRALLGPKMPEDCAAICALKGERPDDRTCEDGVLPDGSICPKCGRDRGPSGVGGGTWVHLRK